MNDLLPFLRANELFADLSDEKLSSLFPFFHIVAFQKGDWIIREGEKGENLFLILSGSVEVVKREQELGEHAKLDQLRVGDFFGEMAHFEKERRSASIRCREPAEILILSLDKLHASKSHQEIYQILTNRLSKKMSQRLRKAGESIVQSLKEKLHLAQLHDQLGKTIVHVFILVSVWFNVFTLLQLFPKQAQTLHYIVTPLLVLWFGLTALYVVKTSSYPLSFYGLTVHKWSKVSFEALLFTIPILVSLFFLKWILITKIDLFKTEPLFVFLPKGKNWDEHFGFVGVYLLLIPFQELVIRGVVQSCFRAFFQGPNRVFLAIFTSTLLFELIHTVKNFWFAIGTFFLGLFWGALYEHQKSLVGVISSHAVVGAWVFLALDFQTMFNLAGQTN